MMKLRSQIKACLMHIYDKTRINSIARKSMLLRRYVLVICDKS